MSLIVNTNVLALNVQRNLGRSSSSLASSLLRLSSGLRVNSAKDDAAGSAVAEHLTSIVRGGRQAIRNANDAISMAQTAESAMGQITGNLQRIREISLQAANGSISDTNRRQLQKEVDQLTQEISRTVQTTEFNGTRLFSGANTVTFQIGFSGSSANQLLLTTTDLAQSLGNPSPAAVASSAIVAAVVNGASPQSAISGADQALRSFIPTGLRTTIGVNTYTVTGYVGGTPAQDAAWAAYKAAEAVYNANRDNRRSTYWAMVDAANSVATGYGWVNSGAGLYSYYQGMTATGTINITNHALAAAAIGNVDSDLVKIADLRATFGAVQNRYEAVVADLQDYVENVSASRSRITDTDFAQEAAQLTRNQILQQAGIAVLSQANASPSAVLTLLR